MANDADLEQRLRDLTLVKDTARSEIDNAADTETLEALRIKYLGKKGLLSTFLKGLGNLPQEKRRQIGLLANEARELVEVLLERRRDVLKRKELEERLSAERIDVSLPATPVLIGRKHPLMETLEEVERIFTSMGFEIAEGPEVEYDYYNFVALNIPKGHPARDMQASFYITDEILLRTHTSPVQIRAMRSKAPALPVRLIATGKVYRRDDDATHSPMFHQIEGLVIDKRVTMGDLKGVLLEFARQMYGRQATVRLRPSYFPFTEPSAEVDVSCTVCGGRGCRTCKGTGWLEILGSGMVHPKVLENGGYDPAKVTGFAFGMGLERIAMLRYGLDDIRVFFQNDIRFLHTVGRM
ncbi:MAG TPA: phenylalanine--tRNA ligase subunit alpha [Clostridia bacterium]|nr:phenylalanine--tRNA ligase subunit alpha [Clostridia bacterium]